MVDITPRTGSDTEVNVGDDVRIEWTIDADVLPGDITLTLERDGEDDITVTGTALSKKTAGGGKYTYGYIHRIDDTHTRGKWELSGSPAGNATDRFYIRAKP